MATRVLVLAALLAMLGLCVEATTRANNFLLPGRGPNKEDILSYRDYRFTLREDCNLVLTKSRSQSHQQQDIIIWQSNTHDNTGCTVQLQRDGKLVVRNSNDQTVFQRPRGDTHADSSISVLHPDGKVVTYGPRVWSRPRQPRVDEDTITSLGNVPRVQNMLFSGQTLEQDEQLRSGNSRLTMQDDCNLDLDNGRWESGTAREGKHCYLRLNHNGQLSIRDDSNKDIWSNQVYRREGEYVAVLLDNGQFEVYGPQIWSTEEQPNRLGNDMM